MGVVDFLELFSGVWIVWVLVWVKLQCQLSAQSERASEREREFLHVAASSPHTCDTTLRPRSSSNSQNICWFQLVLVPFRELLRGLWLPLLVPNTKRAASLNITFTLKTLVKKV